MPAPTLELPPLDSAVQLPDSPVVLPLPLPQFTEAIHDSQAASPGPALPDPQAAAADDAGRATAEPVSGPGGARSRRPSATGGDARLRGSKLRRLRTVLREHWTCAGALSRDQRRALILRAGLFGRRPLARTAVARRVGVGARRALRLERSGVAALRRGGACEGDGSPTTVAASGPATAPAAWHRSGPSAAGNEDTGRRKPDVGAVLGASRSHSYLNLGLLSGRDRRSSPSLLALLAFLAVLCALGVGVTFATRRAGVPPTLLARRRRRSQKPLLFLDVDGVITLWPPIPPGHPGRRHDLGFFSVYISDRCGDFLRALETRYELVWATGWEDDANRYLRGPLGLTRNLPTLRFGDDALWGLSHWKIPAIDRASGSRPVAWLDETIGAPHRSWARQREEPTLLVKTGSRGISLANVRELLAWADSLADDGAPAARPQRTPAAV